jgi:hypothetical protein
VPVLTEEQQKTRKGGRRWGRWAALGVVASVLVVVLVSFIYPIQLRVGGWRIVTRRYHGLSEVPEGLLWGGDSCAVSVRGSVYALIWVKVE